MSVIALPDEAATIELGRRLARALIARAHGVVYLQGEMGTGKTTFARGFLRAAGFSGTLRSPTYTLVEPYTNGPLSILHLDLYRLADPAEVEQLGLADYPSESTIWLIEWPERGAGWLPAPELSLRLRYEGEARVAEAVWAPDTGIDFK